MVRSERTWGGVLDDGGFIGLGRDGIGWFVALSSDASLGKRERELVGGLGSKI